MRWRMCGTVPCWRRDCLLGLLAVFVGLEGITFIAADPVDAGAVLPLPHSSPGRLMRAWLAALLLTASIPSLAATRVVSLSPPYPEMVVELGAADFAGGASGCG